MMRLQKYLAHAGLCSRRKAEDFISQGRIKVNHSVITELGFKIDPSVDLVLFDDKPVSLNSKKDYIYIALNKPEGVVSSCSQRKTKIVMDLVAINERVYPIGRLDKDSKGLILLTNDGNLHNRLSHPSFDHEKEYIVTTAYPVKDLDLKNMADGILIDGAYTRKAEVKRIADCKFCIILKEGRNRQIRKMVEKTGNKVSTLLRVRIAHIHLGNLKEGTWRYLTHTEIKKLTQETDSDSFSNLIKKGR